MYPSQAVTFECALNDATLGCNNVTTWPDKEDDETLATECACESNKCNSGMHAFSIVILAAIIE